MKREYALIKLLIGFTICLLLDSCNKLSNLSNGVSKEVIDAAIQHINVSSHCLTRDECQNFKVSRSPNNSTVEQLSTVSPADVKNGIQEKWVIDVSYAYRAKESAGTWADESILLVCKKYQGGLSCNYISVKDHLIKHSSELNQ